MVVKTLTLCYQIRSETPVRKKNRNRFPKISIVTVVYNNVQYIENCVRSVLDQNYPNLEYIIIDGGSIDGTVQVIEKYTDKLDYFISEKDRGQTHALNKGFAAATGDVFAWINADEQYLPGTLEKVGTAFMENPKLDFFYGNRIIINSNYEEIKRKKWVPMHPKWHLLYLRHVLPTDASFWSVKAHILTGELDETNFPSLGMDIDWFLRLSHHVHMWKNTSQYLSKFMERPDRVTQKGMKYNRNKPSENHSLARDLFFKKHQQSKYKLAILGMISKKWSRIYWRLQRFGLL